MKFLIDHNLSPVVARYLRDAGHHAVHTGDVDLATAEDIEILRVARNESRVIVSADTDFGTRPPEPSPTSTSPRIGGLSATPRSGTAWQDDVGPPAP